MTLREIIEANYPSVLASSCYEASCGRGWFPIVLGLCGKIEQHNNNLKEDEEPVQVRQIKEKFGGLRFYIGWAPTYIHDWIEAAEHFCGQICETCGMPGELRSKGWAIHLCDECYSPPN